VSGNNFIASCALERRQPAYDSRQWVAAQRLDSSERHRRGRDRNGHATRRRAAALNAVNFAINNPVPDRTIRFGDCRRQVLLLTVTGNSFLSTSNGADRPTTSATAAV
jgi:hypothetical protein